VTKNVTFDYTLINQGGVMKDDWNNFDINRSQMLGGDGAISVKARKSLARSLPNDIDFYLQNGGEIKNLPYGPRYFKPRFLGKVEDFRRPPFKMEEL
jgi:hypothetical protein